MAVVIRMARHGNKKRPYYKIVAADVRAPRDGRYIEQIGTFNPLSEELKIDATLVEKWLGEGAKPSDTVAALIKRAAAAAATASAA